MVGNKQIVYPKVLIISGFGMNSNAATDITMRSFFDPWPKENLMLLTTSNVTKTFTKTIILNSDLLLKIRSLATQLFLGNKNASKNKNLVPGAITSGERKSSGIKKNLFIIGKAYRDLFDISIPDDILTTIDDFSPDVVYTILGNRRLIRLSTRISKRYNIRVVPHFMDDWISTIYTGSIWFCFPRKLLFSSLGKLMKNVNTGIGISKKMCDEYEIQFNKKFISLMNSIDADAFRSHKENNPPQENKKISFTYFGGLHLNRWKSLIAFSHVLNSLSQEYSKPLKLEIYTKDEDIKTFSEKFTLDNVIFHSSIDHSDACKKMKFADFLIHVESFDSSVINYTRLSISTKIPEYLSSGTPIIAIGPDNIASIEYLIENKCGYIATSLEQKELIENTKDAIEGKEIRKMSINNIKLVERNHSNNQVLKLVDILKNQ